MLAILRTKLLSRDGLAKVETRHLPAVGETIEVAIPKDRLAFVVEDVEERGDRAYLAVSPVERPARADHVGRLLGAEEIGEEEGEFYEGDGEADFPEAA